MSRWMAMSALSVVLPQRQAHDLMPSVQATASSTFRGGRVYTTAAGLNELSGISG